MHKYSEARPAWTHPHAATYRQLTKLANTMQEIRTTSFLIAGGHEEAQTEKPVAPRNQAWRNGDKETIELQQRQKLLNTGNISACGNQNRSKRQLPEGTRRARWYNVGQEAQREKKREGRAVLERDSRDCQKKRSAKNYPDGQVLSHNSDAAQQPM